MKERESDNILDKAIKALNGEQIPHGPPDELAHATIAKLTEDSGQTETVPYSRPVRLIEILRIPDNFTRFATAAVLLIIAGFTAGRLLSPGPPDIEKIRAALEPEIRKDILNDVSQYLQSNLTAGFARLREQYQRDMNQYAAYTLAASGTATNQLLEGLIESINRAQTQDRQWFAAALGEIELNRLKGDVRLSNALANFAVRTEQNMAQILSYAQPDISVPDRLTDPNNLN
ncbi:MAG: hypothetical protein JW837_05670 [Sedimentisphaerales bacterium]|nr:hypothetical protein [Sedimentisphaerales bacterium]